MKFFKFIERLIVKLNIAIMAVSLAAMIILGFIQIILRNFFDSGLLNIDIIVRNLVLWVGFSGAVVATSKGHHIAIGALLRFIPEKAKRTIYVIVSLATSLVCMVLSYASIKFIGFEQESGSYLFGKFPLWVSELIIPLTFVFLSYQFLIHAFEEPIEDHGERI